MCPFFPRFYAASPFWDVPIALRTSLLRKDCKFFAKTTSREGKDIPDFPTAPIVIEGHP